MEASSPDPDPECDMILDFISKYGDHFRNWKNSRDSLPQRKDIEDVQQKMDEVRQAMNQTSSEAEFAEGCRKYRKFLHQKNELESARKHKKAKHNKDFGRLKAEFIVAKELIDGSKDVQVTHHKGLLTAETDAVDRGEDTRIDESRSDESQSSFDESHAQQLPTGNEDNATQCREVIDISSDDDEPASQNKRPMEDPILPSVTAKRPRMLDSAPSKTELTTGNQPEAQMNSDPTPPPSDRTMEIEFDAVFQNGKAALKEGIEEHPAKSGQFYILRCHSCGIHFQSTRPFQAASKHFRAKVHKRIRPSRDEIFGYFGVRVLNCNSELAESNNVLFLKDARELMEQQNKQAAGKKKHPQEPRMPAAVSRPPVREAQNAAPRQNRTVSIRSDRRRDAITNPNPGEIYKGYWMPSARYFAVVILSTNGSMEDMGIKGTIADFGLLSDQIPPCYCFDAETKTIRGWQVDYLDGGPLAADRQFPVMYIDSDLTPDNYTVGWINACNLEPYDLEDSNMPDYKIVKRYLEGLKRAKEDNALLCPQRQPVAQPATEQNPRTNELNDASFDAEMSSFIQAGVDEPPSMGATPEPPAAGNAVPQTFDPVVQSQQQYLSFSEITQEEEITVETCPTQSQLVDTQIPEENRRKETNAEPQTETADHVTTDISRAPYAQMDEIAVDVTGEPLPATNGCHQPPRQPDQSPPRTPSTHAKQSALPAETTTNEHGDKNAQVEPQKELRQPNTANAQHQAGPSVGKDTLIRQMVSSAWKVAHKNFNNNFPNSNKTPLPRPLQPATPKAHTGSTAFGSEQSRPAGPGSVRLGNGIQKDRLSFYAQSAERILLPRPSSESTVVSVRLPPISDFMP